MHYKDKDYTRNIPIKTPTYCNHNQPAIIVCNRKRTLCPVLEIRGLMDMNVFKTFRKG